MIKDLLKLNQKYTLNIHGVIHVGAHHGQEINIYKSLNIKNIIFIEPLLSNYLNLKNIVKNDAKCFNLALGNFDGETEMYVSTNEGQSSSILEPLHHLNQYPYISFNKKQIVTIKKLDNLMKHIFGYNFLVMDVQGYELEVLKGSINYLTNIDYIITEVNKKELYKNCAIINDIDNFLLSYNFYRCETDWCGETWGDALYIKKH
jgi:FkbM family methyltransferase